MTPLYYARLRRSFYGFIAAALICSLLLARQALFLSVDANDSNDSNDAIAPNSAMLQELEYHANSPRREEEAISNWEYVYISMAPMMDVKLPFPIQRLSSATNHTVSISTLTPALPEDFQKYMKDMLRSLKAQTVPADEVVIVVSDVLTKANASHGEASASDWCAATRRNLVDWYNSSESSKVKLVCVGERMTAGRARNLAARFASGDILSFIDADDQEVTIRNEIIQNMFGLCYPNGQLRLLLHSFTRKGRKHPYYRNSTNETPYGFLPIGKECADKDDPNLKVLRGPDFTDILKVTIERVWLIPTMHHGHMIVHRSLFDHLQFSSAGKSEDALFVRDVLYSYGQTKDTVIFLDRPLSTYYQVNGRWTD
jgi:hypothetical protein